MRGLIRLRAALPIAALAAVILVAATTGFPAFSHVSLRMLIAALKDPLALLSERSPGNRTGALISIKGKTGPSERVLSSVRDRPGLNAPPVVLDIPAGTFAPPSFQEAALVPSQLAGSPFMPASPFGSPDVTPGGTPIPPGTFVPPLTGFIPGETPTTPSGPQPPGVTPPGETPPGGTPPGGTPPGGTPPGETPPGGTPPGETPPGGGTVIVPEPAPWTMMFLGLIATGTLRRRRSRN